MKVMLKRTTGAIAAVAGLCVSAAALGQSSYTRVEQRQFSTTTDQVNGTIDTIMVRELQGDRVVLALVDTQNSFALVNLGPLDELRQYGSVISEGERIRISLKPSHDATSIAVAESLEVSGRTIELGGGESMQFQRFESTRTTSGQQLTGTVQTVRTFDIDGEDHLVVWIRTPDGVEAIDLGLADEVMHVRSQLREGVRIVADATPRETNGYTIHTVETVQVNGQPLQISSTSRSFATNESFRMQGGGTTPVRGTVQTITQRSFEGQRHLVAQVRTSEGRTVTVDLGPASEAEQIRRQIREGQQIAFSGRQQNMGGQTVYMTQQVNVDGERVRISSAQSQSGSAGQIRGTVESITQRSLQGERHLVAQVRTQEGRTVTVDLGPTMQAQHIQQQVREGQQISFSGHQQNMGGQNIYTTQQVNVNGQNVQITSNRGQPQRQQRQDRFGTNERFDDDRAEDRLQRDRFVRDGAEQRDEFSRDQPPYGRAEGYRQNRGMDPLQGQPGRRIGQQRDQWQQRQWETQQNQWDQDQSWQRDQQWDRDNAWQPNQQWDRDQGWQQQGGGREMQDPWGWNARQSGDQQWRDQQNQPYQPSWQQSQWQRDQQWRQDRQAQQGWQQNQTTGWDRDQDQNWQRQSEQQNYWQRESRQQDEMQQRRAEQQRQMQQRQREMEERERQRERERTQREQRPR